MGMGCLVRRSGVGERRKKPRWARRLSTSQPEVRFAVQKSASTKFRKSDDTEVVRKLRARGKHSAEPGRRASLEQKRRWSFPERVNEMRCRTGFARPETCSHFLRLEMNTIPKLR